MTRDMIRDRIFAKKASVVTVTLGGAPVVVRSPTVAERSMIIEKATTVLADGTPKMDFSKLQLYAVIYLAHDSTGARLFEPMDYEPLSQTPVDDELDELINTCVKSLRVKKEEADDVGNG